MKTAIALLAVTLSNLEVNERIARREGRTAEADDKLAEVKDISEALASLNTLDDLRGVSTGHSFSAALLFAKTGNRIRRSIWPENVWVTVARGSESLSAESFWNIHSRSYAQKNGGSATVAPYILALAPDGCIQMGYSFDQSEILADDWEVLPTEAVSTLLDEVIRKAPESDGELVLGGVDLAAPGTTDSDAVGSPVLSEGAVETAPQPESADAAPEEPSTASDAPDSAPDASAPDTSAETSAPSAE